MDGAYRASIARATCGEMARDPSGRWLEGFMSNLCRRTVTKAEQWGVSSRLQLAWRLGYRQVVLEVDSAVVLSLTDMDMWPASFQL